MPPQFRMPGNDAVDMYIPLEVFTELERESRSAHNYQLFGRLSSGTTFKSASKDLQTVSANLAREYIEDTGMSAAVVPLREELAGDARYGLWFLLGTALAVLLIATANLATMNLASHQARQRELAMKLALGGQGWHLIEPAVAETIIIALLGTAFSLVVAKVLFGVLASANLDLLRSAPAGLSNGTMILTLLLGLGSGALFSIAPAWWQYRSVKLKGLDQVSQRLTPHRALSSRILVALQMGVTLLLLLGSGELLSSLVHIVNRKPGFDVDRRMVLSIDLPRERYGDHASQMTFYNELIREIKAIPGVQRIGTVNKLPFSGTWTNSSFEIAGAPARFEAGIPCSP